MSRVIIAGDRNFNNFDILQSSIKAAELLAGIQITKVISGHCRGVDFLGERFAKENNLPLDLHPYLSQYGKAGGPKRNYEMSQVADALIALMAPDSRGTRNMIDIMKKQGKPVFIVYI